MVRPAVKQMAEEGVIDAEAPVRKVARLIRTIAYRMRGSIDLTDDGDTPMVNAPLDDSSGKDKARNRDKSPEQSAGPPAKVRNTRTSVQSNPAHEDILIVGPPRWEDKHRTLGDTRTRPYAKEDWHEFGKVPQWLAGHRKIAGIRIHESHRLAFHKGLAWCWECGGFAKENPMLLVKQCGGQPPAGSGRAYRLGRWRKRQHPESTSWTDENRSRPDMNASTRECRLSRPAG